MGGRAITVLKKGTRANPIQLRAFLSPPWKRIEGTARRYITSNGKIHKTQESGGQWPREDDGLCMADINDFYDRTPDTLFIFWECRNIPTFVIKVSDKECFNKNAIFDPSIF